MTEHTIGLKTTDLKTDYEKNWDQYYQRTYNVLKKKALWDVSPDEAVGADYSVFAPHFLDDLPIIDLGCGTGAQSQFLAQKYNQVVGVDVSPFAISVAKEEVKESNVAFDTMDATDVGKAREIHSKYGDLNIYMRGVLHQILEADQELFQQTILSLMGQKGKMYCVEVSDQIRTHFDESNSSFSRLPLRMRQVFISNLPPIGLSKNNVANYFPKDRFNVLQAEEAKLNTNISYIDGEQIYIPAISVLVEKVHTE